MKKYTFLSFYKESEAFTKDLMDLGVVHIVESGNTSNKEVQKLTLRLKNARTVLKGLKKRKVKQRKMAHEVKETKFPKINAFTDTEKELEKIMHQLDVCKSEIKQLEPWGEIPWQELRKVEHEAGLTIRFFEYPTRKLDNSWREDHAFELINEVNNKSYFVVFHTEDYNALPLVPLVLPKKSLNQLKEDQQKLSEINSELNDTLDGYAKEYTHYLEERIKAVEDRLSFEMAQNNYTDAAEDNVKIMTAWCPKNAEAKLEKLLEKEGVVYLSEEATEEDQPPVLLKNNKFTQLFEPIGKLFSLPAYSELDLTVYFAPFFLLFFGFCLGDMGYGVVLLIATTLFKRKANADIKPYLTLGQLFGISTTVIGFISGTLFGLPMAELPQFAAIKNIFISQDNMFYVALGIGFVQIIFGMCVQVYKQVKFQGWVFALNRIGWIIALLAGLTYLAADKLEYEVLKTPMLVLVILGAVLIVLFGSPKDGALKSIGLGLADLYNITGVAGDLLSYIRLFALGVSSAILGLVINSIGLSFDNIILTPLFLIIGHAANIMLASLSAFVHPMRLTFVEFYKNVGFLGGGKPYIPFKKNYKPSNKNN